MSLPHILLGLLQSPASGYDLRNEFLEGARHFWSAEFGQIYPALAKMERQGWLKSHTEESPKGPPRKVYRRTAKGDRELAQWLAQGPIMGTERFAYLAQLIFLGELHDLAQTRQFLQQLRAKQASLLELLQRGLDETAAAHSDGEASMSDEVFHEWLCLQLSARAVGARVQWCDEAEEILRRREAAKSEREKVAHD